jgi:argininosuccinate lyase
MSTKKSWEGRFREPNDLLFEKMNRSLPFDIRLFKEDILLNRVYSEGLYELGIITKEELASITKGLAEIKKEIAEKGLAVFTKDIEDIHMGIEALLTKKIGDAAKKMHAGKSRNDQVATDVRMYLKNEVNEIIVLLKNFMKTLLNIAEKNIDVIMPGYTHTRQAQPVLFSHFMMSFFFSLERDCSRLKDSIKRISIMPLGSAALAGSSLKLDRNELKRSLGFESISSNSIDAVSSRDFMLEFLSNISILSITLSRYAEDFILFSSEHFNFFGLSDKVTTGSSIMPNKKNPDSLELTRAKTGRILGNFVSLFTMLKALPSSYNKDLQEDKERLFDTIDTIKDILNVNITLLKNLKINKEIMSKSIDHLSFATELADFLTSRNVPFRNAHHTVGRIVLDCIEHQMFLTSFTEEMLMKYEKNFKGIGSNWANIPTFLSKRELSGGTGKKSVKKQIIQAHTILSKI